MRKLSARGLISLRLAKRNGVYSQRNRLAGREVYCARRDKLFWGHSEEMIMTLLTNILNSSTDFTDFRKKTLAMRRPGAKEKGPFRIRFREKFASGLGSYFAFYRSYLRNLWTASSDW